MRQNAAKVLVGLALYPAWLLGYTLGAVWAALRAIGHSFRVGFREADWP